MYERIINEKKLDAVCAIESLKCNRCFGENIKIDEYGISHCLDCYDYFNITSLDYCLRLKRNLSHNHNVLRVDFPLTREQKSGSQFLVNCYKERKNALLQAVCGAGKTEMTLELIKLFLDERKTVGFVIPRVEIIKQVFKRMKSYFPFTSVSCLYGGCILVMDSPFIIVTPQQLIKFYREFDLIIIDEVDAFPFKDNLFLERLVDKSKKDDAMLVYMSATISGKYKKMIDNGELAYFLLAKRYHEQPLPIPKFIQSDGLVNKKVFTLINLLQEEDRGLIIYVSSIKKATQLQNIMSIEGYSVQAITSETLNKNAVLKLFSKRELRILISSTILERGVTFKNVDVIVLQSESEVFTQSSLIQIAGRVGRMGDEGRVIFFASTVSKEMLAAKKAILEFNKQL
ncbi:MAG: helicase-related protein [Candidatus Izemoplasmatales bacterium]|nr:helicase-related protein [Candidatus Izemoplasmatales bacterium]